MAQSANRVPVWIATREMSRQGIYLQVSCLVLFLGCFYLELCIKVDMGFSVRGTQRQFLENNFSEDDLRSRIFGTFVVNFFACLPLLGFSNI